MQRLNGLMLAKTLGIPCQIILSERVRSFIPTRDTENVNPTFLSSTFLVLLDNNGVTKSIL